MAIEIASPQNILVLICLAGWGAALFGGLIFGQADDEQTHRIPRPMRMLSSFALAIGAWLLRSGISDPVAADLMTWLAVGMSLGFIGDLFMAKLLPAPNRVIGGMAAFGLGHIAYIFGLVRYTSNSDYTDPAAFIIALGVWWVAALVFWYRIVYRTGERTAMHLLALPYALLLAGTAGVATGLGLQADAFMPVGIGAGLFLFSDLMLAAQIFNDMYFPLIGDTVWLLYGPGQMLIVYGAMLPSLLGGV